MQAAILRNVKAQELRKRESLIQAGVDQIAAQAFNSRELDGLNAEFSRCVDVDLLIIEKEGLVGTRAELLQSIEVDFRIGLGEMELIAPDEDIEVIDPLKLALDAFKNRVAHIGKDGGA